ncbi:GGDEF domain-containing protein [Kineosporia babensis]|uniref:GGDEF domain-containing protein n=1 Tax=Kineosporia babensis TaxID=499548 RepID=A0A9X1NNG2_9ACTN|nr:GGDEF domain-containing protein [Kineosporia babensis]MCD5316979.1 GGDEF domain-containing protein [Kineosporia babensis]
MTGTLLVVVVLWHIVVFLRWRRQLQAARHEARRDALTGLGNRRALMEALQESGAAIAMLGIMDLDGFKPVNDRYGHHAGDQVLRTIAQRLQAVSAGHRISAYRMGGDEFAVIWWDATDRPTEEAHDLLDDVVGPTIQVDKHLLKIEASIGLALNTDAGSTENLTRTADAALYICKRSQPSTTSRADDPREPNGGRRPAATAGRQTRVRVGVVGHERRQGPRRFLGDQSRPGSGNCRG